MYFDIALKVAGQSISNINLRDKKKTYYLTMCYIYKL